MGGSRRRQLDRHTAAATVFGVAGLTALARSGAFNIGFATMPVVFQQLPMGRLLGALWFGLLFLAGITSSVAMLTPVIAFVREEFGFRREAVARSLGLVTFAYGLMHIAWLEYGFLDEWDYWAGTFGLVVMAILETIIFIWVFRPENAWRSIHDGADIRLPQVFKFIMQWVTPLYLLVILGWWGIQNALPFLTLERSAGVGQVPEEADPYILMARAILPFFVVALAVLVHVAGKRGTGVREGNGFSLAELESQESTGRAG